MVVNEISCSCGGVMIPLGRQGENKAVQIRFKLLPLIERYGAGMAVLLHRRSRDIKPYPVAVNQVENELIWDVSAADTDLSGIGNAEIRWYTGDVLAKSIVFQTVVQKSLPAPYYSGDPGREWAERVLEAGASAKVDADRAENAAESIGDSVSSAAQSAESAASSMEGATTAATAANTSAADAASAAERAAQSAESANINKLAAEQAAQSADDAATRAEEFGKGAEAAKAAAAESQQEAKAAADQAKSTVEGAIADINAAGIAQTAAVEQKGAEVLESIPEDYNRLSESINDISDVVFVTTKGANIYNSDDVYIVGKSIQNWSTGTTTYNDLYDSSGMNTYPIMEVDTSVKKYVAIGADGNIRTLPVVGFYNANGVSIEYKIVGLTYFDVPDGCKYIRFSTMSSSIVSVQPYDGKDSGYIVAPYGDMKSENYATKSELSNEISEIKKEISVENLPVIVFDFDMTNLDNRYHTLQKYGFTGTWQFSDSSLAYSKDVIKTLVKNGHDISPYGGLTESEMQTEESVQKIKTRIDNLLSDMNQLGLYNPVMWSCSGHKSGWALTEAVKQYPFKYVRCTYGINKDGSTYYINSSTNPNEFEQYVVGLAYANTFEKAKTRIDSRLSSGNPLTMLFCHDMAYDNITEENYFENVVAYVKQLVDEGKCLVMNMREYYEYYYPEQGKKDDRTRLMSAIVDLHR